MSDELKSHAKSADSATSRRAFLRSSAGLAAGGAVAQALTERAFAQPAGNADAGLARVQEQRRILIKGGVVLSLDPRVGDFAQADVLIEDGKIREVRPAIVVSAEGAAVVDATNRIVLPGFIDTHHHFYQGILRNILTNGLLNPDYNRDVSNTLTAAYQPSDVYAGVLVTREFAPSRNPACARSMPIRAGRGRAPNTRRTSPGCRRRASTPATSC